MGFEVHGARGALAWDFQRMNELQLHLPNATGDVGWTTVFAGPRHGDFARFQPDAAVAMGYDDLKVCEARLFLDSVVDGVQRNPGAGDALAVARVLAALRRSAAADSALEPVIDLL
jgi:predicted dehydrogenase